MHIWFIKCEYFVAQIFKGVPELEFCLCWKFYVLYILMAQGYLARKKFARKILNVFNVYLSFFIFTKLCLKSESLLLFQPN